MMTGMQTVEVALAEAAGLVAAAEATVDCREIDAARAALVSLSGRLAVDWVSDAQDALEQLQRRLRQVEVDWLAEVNSL